ncbi:MAG: hypothetical protein Q4Q17_04510 [Tissierellia bacterium]|nr:hypothetical protein [Tissierellia bacterium]
MKHISVLLVMAMIVLSLIGSMGCTKPAENSKAPEKNHVAKTNGSSQKEEQPVKRELTEAEKNYSSGGEGTPDVTEYILKAKELFPIEDDYDSVSSNLYGEEIHLSWDFRQPSEGTYRSVHVQFNRYKEPIEYNKYLDNDRFERSALTMDEAKKRSEALLLEIYPHIKGNYRLREAVMREEGLHVYYEVLKKDVPVFGSEIQFSFRKSNGELSHFYANKNAYEALHYDAKINFTPLAKEEALELFLEKNPLLLMLGKDYGEDNYKPYYRVTYPQWVLRADTKELLYAATRDTYDTTKEESTSDKSLGNRSSLTPAERKEIEKLKNIKTKPEALAKVSEIFHLDPEFLKESQIMKAYQSEDYSYYFRYGKEQEPNYTVSLRAKDLLPMSYYSFSEAYDPETDKVLTEDEINQYRGEAQYFIENYLPFYQEYVHVPTQKDSHSLRFHYYRKLDEYLVDDDSFGFTYVKDGLSSYILNRNFNEISYEEKKLDLEEAKAKMAEVFRFEYSLYPKMENGKIQELIPIYSFSTLHPQLNAIDGTDKNAYYQGRRGLMVPKGTPKDKDFVFDDVLSYGFGVAKEKSYTDLLTIEDLLMNLSSYEYTQYEPRKILIDKYKSIGLFSKESLEKKATLTDFLQTAVLTKLNLKDGDLSDEIFADLFKKTPENRRGVVNLAYGFGWIDKDADVEATITVEEGLKLLTHILFDK